MLQKSIDRRILLSNPEMGYGMLSDVLTHVEDLADTYPNFSSWIQGKVLPGIISGERTILVEYRRDSLAGLAILKNSPDEKKLCCLRVLGESQNSGMGIRLFERSFEAIGTDKPFLTISEEKSGAFQKIFSYFGFELAGIYQDAYRSGKAELSFNGELISSIALPTQSVKQNSQTGLAIF